MYQVLDYHGNEPFLQQPADSIIRDHVGADFGCRLIPTFTPSLVELLVWILLLRHLNGRKRTTVVAQVVVVCLGILR